MANPDLDDEDAIPLPPRFDYDAVMEAEEEAFRLGIDDVPHKTARRRPDQDPNIGWQDALQLGLKAGRLDEFLSMSPSALSRAWIASTAALESLAEGWLAEAAEDPRAVFLFLLNEAGGQSDTRGKNLIADTADAIRYVLECEPGREDFHRAVGLAVRRAGSRSRASLALAYEEIWQDYSLRLDIDGLTAAADLIRDWHDRESELRETFVAIGGKVLPERGMPGRITRILAPWALRRALGTKHCFGGISSGVRHHHAAWRANPGAAALLTATALESAERGIRNLVNIRLIRQGLDIQERKVNPQTGRGRSRRRLRHNDDLLLLLCQQPIVDVHAVRQHLKITDTGARKIIRDICAAGLLRPLDSGDLSPALRREHGNVWIADRILDRIEIR